MADPIMEFHVDGVEDDALRVREAHGTEAISGLFRFTLDMYSQKDDLKPATVLKGKAWLGVRAPIQAGVKGATRMSGDLVKIHGVLSSFEQAEKVDKWYRYRATLDSLLWRLTLSRRNRVFLEKSVKDLISLVTKPLGSKAEVSLSGNHPPREYTAQYQETDFDFLSRWLEHEGIFFYSDHTGKQEALTFGDNSAVHKTIGPESTVKYMPHQVQVGALKKEGFSDGTVGGFKVVSRPLPAEVVLQDYDEKEVKQTKATASVDSDGFGKVYEYGFHPKDAQHAQALAKARAEAIQCRGRVFVGAGACRSLRPGFTFQLDGHYKFDGKYLVTRVTHRVSQPLGIQQVEDLPAAYSNEFECIPSDVPFRPERVTPWPRISGFLDAQVTTGKDDGGRKLGDVNEDGCYKINMFYDEGDDGKAAGSKYIRMAQPYGGEGFGMHFPLAAENEVVIGHKNGDPDRPVILSVLPNPKKASPVVKGNTSQCVLKSSGNNMIRFEDKKDGEDFFLHASKDMDTRIVEEHKLTVGKDQHVLVNGARREKIGGMLHQTVTKNRVEKTMENAMEIVKGNKLSGVAGLQCEIVKGVHLEINQSHHVEQTTGVLYLKAANIVLESTGGISLVCGGNHVVINAQGVTVKGAPTVTIDGAMTKINSGPGAQPEKGPTESKQEPEEPEEPKEANQC